GLCAQFFDAAPSRDPRMGNGTMDQSSWPQSMGGRSGWTFCHASFRSGLSPYLRGPSAGPLYHGLGTLDFSRTRNVDRAEQSSGTLPRKRGDLSPIIGWSRSISFLYGGCGRDTVARSFSGRTRGASPSDSSRWGVLSSCAWAGCGTTSGRTGHRGHQAKETQLRFCCDVRLSTGKFPHRYRAGIFCKPGNISLLGTVLSLGSVALYWSR